MLYCILTLVAFFILFLRRRLTGAEFGGARYMNRFQRERECLIDNLLVRIHVIIVMIRWTGLAPCQFDFPFPGSLASTFLVW